MQKECYTQVAFIVIRVHKDEPLLNVPLYVKVNEVAKDGVSSAQKAMVSKASEIMNKRYESQIRNYFAELNEEQAKARLTTEVLLAYIYGVKK